MIRALTLAFGLALSLLDGGGLPPAAPEPLVLPTALATPVRVVHRVHLPALVNVPKWMLATAMPTATASPTPRPTQGYTHVIAGGDWRALEKALMVPGAVVRALPGVYRPTRVLHMAPGVRLEAEGALLVDRGLYLYRAHGAIIRGLQVDRTTGDGIQISGSRDVLVEGVHISGAGDGCLDVVEGPEDGRESWITVRDSTITDCRKGMLLGDQDQPQDALLRVRLIRVRFIRVGERGPKAQRVHVWIEGGQAEDWGGTSVDARMGSVIRVSGTSFRAGRGSGSRFQTWTGGRIIEGTGNTYTPWAGAQ